MAYAVFGGITPTLITLRQRHDVLANAHYVAAMGLLGFALGFVPLASRGWQPAGARA
ncbi:hypothetical protein AVKW3434_06190 [Acidovorax sp. SUPP3434]|nr:hypothetical protein AVKW3434_06190 [Acidovorax sp. SUPP3434]